MLAEDEISGRCDPAFAGVREALRDNFAQHGEIGAAVAVTIDGRPVVDLWGGWADGERRRRWREDTLVNVFSVGKGVATVAFLSLVERGLIALDRPVAAYWPEFAAAGKQQVTLRTVLSHRAGLPALRAPLPDEAMYDLPTMANALAAEEPWWEPDRAHGYHVNTFGFLLAELVRRICGETIGAVIRATVTGPLSADFQLGIAAREAARVADYIFAPELFHNPEQELGGSDEQRRYLLQRVYFNPPGISGLGTVNSPAWRAAEMPSTNAHSNARAVARIYGALAGRGTLGHVRTLAPDLLAEATRVHSDGPDQVLGRPTRYGLGFQLTQPEARIGPNPHTFGHFGAGGSLGFADPDAGLSFGYTMNRAGPRQRNPRVRGLIDAVYAALR